MVEAPPRAGEKAGMVTARTAAEVAQVVEPWRTAGHSIGFVPTMGALHEGHLALVRKARETTARVGVSVFVNPAQFGPSEDFARYPRDPEGDARLLAGAGCDLLFLPYLESVYPAGHSTFIDVSGPSEGLEGDFRPGHFRGVATVVAALFNLVRPDVAVFGEKDAQQLAVVRQLVRDLHFPVEILAHPTVREPDGLAMSSRNAYLSREDRRAATILYRALTTARQQIEQGERAADAIRRTLTQIISAEPRATLQYAEVVDASTFQPLTRIRGAVVLPVAARFGSTRLIDNLRLEVS
jgi:pantoate--beta-alanine ligase